MRAAPPPEAAARRTAGFQWLGPGFRTLLGMDGLASRYWVAKHHGQWADPRHANLQTASWVHSFAPS
jgi:hypothetical protein